MSAKGKRLKDEYKKSLWIFIAANIAIFWGVWVTGVIFGKATNEILSTLLSPKAFFLPLVPILTTALSGFLPQTVKEVIVFFRFKNRLPGCRAFSIWAHRDLRIDPDALVKKHGILPKDPFQENRLWYSIYKVHQNEPIILTSHKDYLMLRDFASVAVIFLFAGTLSIWFAPCNYSIKAAYIVVLFAQSLLLQFSARNYGVRFVTNVLSAEIESIRTGQKKNKKLQ